MSKNKIIAALAVPIVVAGVYGLSANSASAKNAKNNGRFGKVSAASFRGRGRSMGHSNKNENKKTFVQNVNMRNHDDNNYRGYNQTNGTMVSGTVVSISGNSITVTGTNGTTYNVDGTNAGISKSGATSTVSALVVGDVVRVWGTVNGSAVTATQIIAGTQTGHMYGRGNAQNPGTSVTGTVSAVSGATVTVVSNGTSYAINTGGATITRFINGSSSTVSVSNVLVGDVVQAWGTVSGTTVTATAIYDWSAGSAQSSSVTGTVSSVSGSTIFAVSGGTTYAINASGATITRFVNGASSTVSISGILAGDVVQAWGTISGTTVTAATVYDWSASLPGTWTYSSNLVGTVSSVSGAIVTMVSGSTTYTVNTGGASITRFVSGSAPVDASVSSIQIGDTLHVWGATSGTTINAAVIFDQVSPSWVSGANLIGAVSSVNGTTVYVISGGTTYTVNASGATVIKFVNGSAPYTASVSSLLAGESVRVWGSISGTTVTANTITDGI